MIRKFVVFFLFVTIHEMFFVLLGMNDPINTILFFLRVVDFAAGVAAEPSERAGIVSGRSALRRQGVLGGRASIGRGSCNSCPSREVRGKPGGDSFFFSFIFRLEGVWKTVLFICCTRYCPIYA